jgi:hypothetical protein
MLRGGANGDFVFKIEGKITKLKNNG